MNSSLENEIRDLMQEFRVIFKDAQRATSRVLSQSGQIMVYEAQRRAPVGSRVHHRYGTTKFISKKRAAKGSGNIVATYRPGNLVASIQLLRFRRAKNSVFVGPKLAKASNTTPDGYYAHMVEFGTRKMRRQPFMAPAHSAAGNRVLNDLIARMKQKIERKKK